MQVRKIVNVLYKDTKQETSKLVKKAINVVSKKTAEVPAVAFQKIPVSTRTMPIENPIIRNYYEKKPIVLKNQRLLAQAQDLSLKLKNVEDEGIKNSILGRFAPFSKTSRAVNLDYYISALDAYHGVNNHYSVIKDEVQEFIKYYNKEVKPTAKKTLDIKSFEKARKLEPLKNFCRDYQTELSDYMYKEYYLRDLPLESKNMCRKIITEFGTKVFLENDDNHKAASAIYKELSEWKKAGKDEAILPTVIDCSPIKQLFIAKKVPAEGFAFVSRKSVALDGDEKAISSAGRHEIGHINDINYFVRSEEIKRIIAKAYKPVLDKMPFDWLKKLTIHVVEELRIEEVAEATEKDYAKLSERKKGIYSGLGVPKWVFDMTPVKDMNYFG